MKKFIFTLIIILIAAGVWYFQKGLDKSDPPLSLINQVIYNCDDNKTIDASFYQGEIVATEPNEPPTLTGIVKLILDDGRNFDLPQTISADGGRYANSDESFVFWSKGDGALILESGIENNYTNCVVITPATDESNIKVISPNGGEVWTKGQPVKITWTSSEGVKTVDIRLSISDGNEGQNFNAAIASNIPNTGIYDWTVQDLYAEVLGITALPYSAKYFVTIEDSEHNNIYDTNDIPFSIE